MLEIKAAYTLSDFQLLEQLAETIWREHYTPIIGEPQVDYMLAKFNTVKAIESQIKEGSQFYYMLYKSIPAGYMSFKEEGDYMFLSKFYVKKEFRGKKIGKASLKFIMDEAKRLGLKSIYLNVNKFNTASISAYEKLGFIKTKAMVTDIGNGFVMDDYEMKKDLN